MKSNKVMVLNNTKQQVGFYIEPKDLEKIDKAAEKQKRSRASFFIASAVKEADIELRANE